MISVGRDSESIRTDSGSAGVDRWSPRTDRELIEHDHQSEIQDRESGFMDGLRAVVEQESGWQRCAVSRKGAVGLMQLMPRTAARLNVHNRCDINQNVSGGVRYLA